MFSKGDLAVVMLREKSYWNSIYPEHKRRETPANDFMDPKGEKESEEVVLVRIFLFKGSLE